jgi:myo-inositol-1(or 4)-monophosphatase
VEDDLALLLDAGAEAGRIAMGYFAEHAPNEVWTKQGNSPVSEADLAVDDYLRRMLLSARPDYGWLSEETEDTAHRLTADRLFVVDPIDGTRGFLAGRKEWCISMAIVENERPVAGVLECPAMGRRFSASAETPAQLNGNPIPKLIKNSVKTVTASRKLNVILESQYHSELEVLPFIPSLAYRIAMVATGEIDAAFARPGAHDWDLAAAEIILQQSGGVLTDIAGQPKRYNQQSPRSGSLLASGISNHTALMKLAKSGGFLH